MRILLCSQFYAPSVGGVQEVVRQLGENLAARGHEVTVATTEHPDRNFRALNGVSVKGFRVYGNLATGMGGDVDGYREFVRRGSFDVVMIYAAQQWTFDALWPVFSGIRAAKIFVPSGFAGLYESGFRSYYRDIRTILCDLDHLVFHATHYRDIDFVRNLGLSNMSVIPNGAALDEFTVAPDPGFRAQIGIAAEEFIFLTVGSFTGLKGHLELALAFERLQVPAERKAVLVLNGNEVGASERGMRFIFRKLLGLIRMNGIPGTVRHVVKKVIGDSAGPKAIAQRINAAGGNKRILIMDLPRSKLVQLFMSADLFVFASNIEYSPLVLFECAAAGTPFLTVDVGNAWEIADMTGAGIRCASSRDDRGYTRVEPDVLAHEMRHCMDNEERLRQFGASGRAAWRAQFTWAEIAGRYESLFQRLAHEGRA